VITAEAPQPAPDPAVRVIEVAEALEKGHTTVADALSATPGVSIQQRGSSFEPSTVRVRGSSAEQVLVLRDGRPLKSAGSGFADLSRISLRGVEQIEVILGPATALYGGGGAAGAINLISSTGNRGDARSFTGSSSAEYGSFGEYRLGGEVFAPLGAGELTASIDGAYAQNEYTYGRDGSAVARKNAGGWLGEAQLGLSRSFDSASLHLRGSIDSSDRGIPGTVEFPSDSARLEEAGGSVVASLATGGAGESGGTRIQPEALPEDSSRWGTVSRLGGGREERSYTDPDYPLGALSSQSTLYAMDAGFAARGPVAAGTVNLPVGYSFEALRESELGERERHSIALAPGYVAPRFSLGASSLGLRVTSRIELIVTEEANSSSNPQMLPSFRASLSRRSPEEWIETSLVFGAGYRLPSYSELFWPAGGFALGNPDLEPETSRSLELEVRLGRGDPGELRLNTHVTWYRDLIQWLPNPSGYWRPRNTGEAIVYGGEAAYERREAIGLSPWNLASEAAVGVLFALDQNDGPTSGKQLPYRPRYDGSLSLELAHLLGHRMGVSFRGVGERPVTAQNTLWLDPYLAVDLSVGYTIPGSSVALRGRVNNLLDQEFVETRFYPNPGREFVFGMEVSW